MKAFRVVIILLIMVPAVEAEMVLRQWTAFRQEDGLVNNWVTSVLQGPDGAMWFGTGNGISRYDGRQWKTYTEEDGLPGNFIRDMYVDPNGTVRAASARRGRRESLQSISRLSKEGWEEVVLPVTSAPYFGIRQILGLENDSACIVTESGAMLHLEHDKWQTVTRSDGEEMKDVQCLLRTNDGRVLVAYGGYPNRVLVLRGVRLGGGGRRGGRGGPPTSFRGGGRGGGFPRQRGSERGVSRLSEGDPRRNENPGNWGMGLVDPKTGMWENFEDGESLAQAGVFSMAQSPDGAFWFGTEEGVRRYFGGKWEIYTTENGLPSNRVEVLQVAPDGSVWLGTPAGAARSLPGRPGDWQVFTERDGLPNSFVTSLTVADDGTIWVGTRGGAARYGSVGWMHHSGWAGKDDRGRFSIERGTDGTLWASTSESVYRLDGDRWLPVYDINPQQRLRNSELVAGRNSDLWASIRGGLLHFDGNRWQVFPLPQRWPISSLFPAREGGVWVAGVSGVYRFDGSNWETHSLDVAGPVTAVYEDPNGAVWFGIEGGILREIDGVQRHFTADDGLPAGRVNAISGSTDGRVWVSTSFDGVAVFDGKKWERVPSDSDVTFNDVNQIYAADDGTIWLASPVEGAIHLNDQAWVRYTVNRGLPGSSVWDICEDNEGQVWFATDAGPACYTPDREAPVATLIAPPEEVAPLQAIMFEFEAQDAWKQTSIESIQFSWRLNDQKWSPFSGKNQALFRRLRAGEHKLEVRAMDMAFNVTEMPTTHIFRVLAPVWMRPWFQVLFGGAFLAIVFSSGYALQRHRRWRDTQQRLIVDLEAELQEAHEMQMSLLPREAIREGRFEIAGRCVPANHVGGDYYNYFWLSEEEQLLGFGAADVSGKAMKAAVRAMQLSGIFRYEFRNSRPVQAVLEDLDQVLLHHLDRASFITCCIGILDVQRGCVRLGNAAHPTPYRYVASTGELEAIEMPSLPLGITVPPGTEGGHEDREIEMAPGDLLIIYSDGVTDMQNEAGDFYEEGRLEKVIHRFADDSAESLMDGVLKDLNNFKGSMAQTDDVTMLVLRILPEGDSQV